MRHFMGQEIGVHERTKRCRNHTYNMLALMQIINTSLAISLLNKHSCTKVYLPLLLFSLCLDLENYFGESKSTDTWVFQYTIITVCSLGSEDSFPKSRHEEISNWGKRGTYMLITRSLGSYFYIQLRTYETDTLEAGSLSEQNCNDS